MKFVFFPSKLRTYIFEMLDNIIVIHKTIKFSRLTSMKLNTDKSQFILHA